MKESASTWQDVATVEKAELVDMAQNIFESLVHAIDDLGGHQLAQNVKEFAGVLEQQMTQGNFPLAGTTTLIGEMWQSLSPRLGDWAKGILGSQGFQDILNLIASGQLSSDLLAQIAKMSDNKQVAAFLRNLSMQVSPWQDKMVDQIVQWAQSEHVMNAVLLLARAESLMQLVLSQEVMALAEQVKQATPALLRLTELLSQKEFAEVVEFSQRAMKNPKLLTLLETLENHIDTANQLLNYLSRFEERGGLQVIERIMDAFSGDDVNVETLAKLPAITNKGIEFADWALNSGLPELTQNMLLAIDVSLAEAKKDTTKYGAMRLVGALKDPAIQDGIKVGMAFLRHLPNILTLPPKSQPKADTHTSEHEVAATEI
ncbi:DUF1641 domain-containing protein [Sulfobacillus thermosulfidooxidans]|uniref:DUF1641 domain-containing protein n=1 Tax=Sulfobacillus thermosulfidooxidans TaxID=28034 RepID=UPI0006B52A2A|nr:DUF1641 domain-containing protein [Sulfobacillus thermosulfidooxidans]